MRARLTCVMLLASLLSPVFGCATGRLNYTKGKTAVCEVHHQKMIKTIVPAHYGLTKVTPREEALNSAHAKAFPHAEDSVNPGCTPRSQREALVYACPECVKARREWEANYNSGP